MIDSKSVQYLILGAGPTGLGAAYRLKELGIDDFLILEKENQPGGLAASFFDEKGFTWDIGGHVQFSHYKYFDELMDKALGKHGWIHHERESWIWIEDRFVPYPFQNNIRYLSKEKMWKCLSGLIELYQSPQKDPLNFEEWILDTQGKGLAEVFMFPYNFKVWAHPLSMLDYRWVGERVSVVDLRRLTENVLFDKDDVSWGPNNTFRFPKKGGTGAVWLGVAKLIGYEKFRLETIVKSVNMSRKIVTTHHGASYQYQNLINTFPLDLFSKMIEDAPKTLAEKASGLLYSSTHIFGVGLKGQPPSHLQKKCWIYFPENNNPFYRVTVFSNYSPQNVPDIRTYWSLMAEVSESRYKTVNPETLLEEVIQGMINTKLITSKKDVVSTWSIRAGHGYPIPTIERNQILDSILPELEKQNIYSRGRFGGWKYEVSNQDHSLMQGVEVINRLENNELEITLPFPNKANVVRCK